MSQQVKNLPEMQEIQVWSLGWGDSLEKEMATHFRLLAWKIPRTERSLVTYCPKGPKESDTTEWLSTCAIPWPRYSILRYRYSLRQISDQISCSVTSDSAIPWIAAHQASLSITNSQSLLKLMSIESVDATQPSHPLLSPSPPAPNPSQHQGLFQWVISLHEVAKVLEFQL